MSSTTKLNVGKYLRAKIKNVRIPFPVSLKLRLINTKLGIENTILAFFQWALYSRTKACTRILIFRTGSLGDSINSIPSIRAVADKYPSAEIDILTNAGAKNLVGIKYLIERDLYNEIIDYDGLPKRKLVSFLRQKKYDLVIQLPQVDAIFFTLLRDLFIFRVIASSGIGWFVSQCKWFRKTQAEYLVFANENERLLSYLKKKNFEIQHVAPKLVIQDSDKKYVDDLMFRHEVALDKKKICIVVGAKRSQNRWPIHYFKKVAQHFSGNAQILLIGSSEDQILVAPLLEIPNIISFCGKLTPMQSAALISYCNLTLSNDTGPMHMSYAVQTPTIALFSSRDLPGKWYPPEKNNYVFRAEGIKCQACFSEICANNICMQAIMPEEVISVMEKIIVA